MAPGDGDGGLQLPEDIILEVLLRLPAKALDRFLCVCKAWHAIISDPAFVATQRSRATGPFIVAEFGSAPEHELRLLDMGGNVLRVFDVRGGTALLAPTRLDLILVDRAELGALVIDPASGRDFTIIGTKDVTSDYSFGRAAASGDYKVLHLLASSYRHGRRCEVITIMDGGGAVPVATRRQRPWGQFQCATFSCQDKATANGVLYFLYNPHPNRTSHAANHLAAFDLDSEEWRQKAIKCPPLERKELDVWQIALTELKGTLCVVQNIRHNATCGGHYVNLYLLMDPNKSIWVQEYRIQMPLGFLMSTKPLYVLGDGTTLLLKVSRDFKRYFFMFYNSSTEDFTDIMEVAHGFNGIMAFYTGILLS